jgi:hypothetical protein
MSFFSHFPNRKLEHAKLLKILQTKGLKILCTVKTCWINMFTHNKDVLTKYKNLVVKMLVVKMHDDMVENAFAKNNYERLCGYDIILGLTCVLGSAKFVQVGPW